MPLPEKIIGIVGADGDLGRQLASMAAEHGFSVLRTDLKRIVGGVSLQTIMDDSDIVHFAIPEHGFEDKYTLRPGQLALLNDSVMATSAKVNEDHFDGHADSIHTLMNERPKDKPQDKLLRLANSFKHGFRIYPAAGGTVVVEQDNPHLDLVKAHMSALGLQPVEMSKDKHDYIAARSQAVFAILVKLLLNDLRDWNDAGLLTPSGKLVLSASESRDAIWTDETMKALLKNPELPNFIADMQKLIENGGEI